jgi:CubicO group peptidase (beta-lactamase class C family)
VTVRQLLSHQAGVVALRRPLAREALYDWDAIVTLLAAEAPFWAPGSAHGEHALFYGHLCGELVRRVDGRSLGAFWRDEVARPWSLDFHIGLMPHEQARAVDLTGAIARGDGGAMYRQALENPPGLTELDFVNSVAWRAAEIPAVNGHGTAMAITRFYAGLLGGGELEGRRLVSEETVAAMIAGEMTGPDLVMNDEFTWGLGVAIEPDGFGMGGIGGSLGWAEPGVGGGFAFGYATRQMGDHDRALAMDAVLREVLKQR